MTETTVSKPTVNVHTIFTNEYPVSFRITDEKHEERLYLENEPTSGLLELSNNSGRDIYFIPFTEPEKKGEPGESNSAAPPVIAGPDNFHFALKFRPGILQTTLKSLIKNKLIKKGWALSIGLVSVETGMVEDEKVLLTEDAEPVEVIAVLYFLNTNKAKLDHGKSIILPLNHLHLDCEEGTQVTKVELFCNNLARDNEYKDRIKSRLRHYDLTIINHRGSPHMPVHIGFTGFNAILNDGSANQLRLRITNLQLKTPESNGTLIFSHRRHSKIYLYFKTDKQNSDYALGTANTVSEIGAEVTNPHQQNGSNLITEALLQGDDPIWEIFPDDDDVVLQPHLEKSNNPVTGIPDDSTMDIVLSNLKTTFPLGVTHVYLRFENIPGFWDRTFSIPLLKQPMVFKTIDSSDRVGIGTVSPSGKLAISSGALTALRIDCNASVSALNIGGHGDVNVDAPGIIGGRFTVKDDGKVGIGTATPNQKVEIGGNGGLGFAGTGLNSADKKLYSPADGDLEWMTHDSAGVHGFAISHQGTKKVYLNTSGNSYLNGGNVGIGTTTPARRLEVNNAMKFTNNSADPNDGVIGTQPFLPGLNIVGINTDGAGRKINSWGSLIQNENAAGNTFVGNTAFPAGIWNSSGNIGIGTTNPVRGRLEVISYTSYEFSMIGGIGTMGGNNVYGNLGAQAKAAWGSSIFAEGKILAHSFVVPSDLRTKIVTGKSDSRQDLETINTIEVTDYQMKDVIAKGNTACKKVVAQQIKEVYPIAVSVSTDAVPDIYQHAHLEKEWIKLPTDLNIGEKVQLIFGSEKQVFEVLETNETGFRVASEREGNVFVYGREVDDFLSVDYEAISMLNVSATQELSKQLELLKSENQQLKDEQEKMKKEMAAIKEMLGMKMELIS